MWHRMTRMTGPDCAVMCNLIITYIRVVVFKRLIIEYSTVVVN